MLIATVVTNEAELEQVHALNKESLKQNLSVDERKKEGFVTWLYSMQLLKEMHKLAPSVIIKEDEQVVGYALVTLKEAAHFHSDLEGMINNLETLSYLGKTLFSYHYYCMGQVCIHKDYRGQGLFAMLYQTHKDIYSGAYNLLVTEISTSNQRSQKAHEAVGFKTIHTYTDSLDEWNVVVWDWK